MIYYTQTLVCGASSWLTRTSCSAALLEDYVEPRRVGGCGYHVHLHRVVERVRYLHVGLGELSVVHLEADIAEVWLNGTCTADKLSQ